MAIKLEDDIRECKKPSLETNECLNKIEVKEALKKGKNGHNETLYE